MALLDLGETRATGADWSGRTLEQPRIAVIIPCYNEEVAIGRTVSAFRAALPDAAIYVYDNNSKDASAAIAAEAGAIVRIERVQGKGAVVRRMFADVDADVSVMADGDATYDSSAAPGMVELLLERQLDMVVGTRVPHDRTAYRLGHQFGNRVLTAMLARMFGRSFSDILSGYRVFSRRFVKSFPVASRGFEIETEMSVHALELAMPVGEVETVYQPRPEGSSSKLSTFRDGLRILRTMTRLYRFERPTWFFGAISFVLAALAVILAWPLVLTYLETGAVPRLPTAVLVTGMMVMAGLLFTAGIILDTVTRGRTEVKRLVYLSYPPPGRATVS